ncbi:MAG: M48 family metallopeptidase [Candidatus Omnitrophica bacterium]|nr:M48 family metallopeptidase [Candidatus Omnitrophota bacterium]
MKFVSRQIRGNVNITPYSPFREFCYLLGGISGIVLAIYLILGAALDQLAVRMPVGVEKKLGNMYLSRLVPDKASHPLQQTAQDILDAFVPLLAASEFDFRVYITENEAVNALALPGGGIVIFSGLLDKVKSENELAMVIAHELGHFAHRDHIRGMGRGLVLMAVSTVVFGGNNVVSETVMNLLMTSERRFSRKQEAAADRFALRLLYRRYGHVAGATELFVHIHPRDRLPRFMRLGGTHPEHSDRIRFLEEEIERHGYQSTGEIVPLPKEHTDESSGVEEGIKEIPE